MREPALETDPAARFVPTERLDADHFQWRNTDASKSCRACRIKCCCAADGTGQRRVLVLLRIRLPESLLAVHHVVRSGFVPDELFTLCEHL